MTGAGAYPVNQRPLGPSEIPSHGFACAQPAVQTGRFDFSFTSRQHRTPAVAPAQAQIAVASLGRHRGMIWLLRSLLWSFSRLESASQVTPLPTGLLGGRSILSLSWFFICSAAAMLRSFAACCLTAFDSGVLWPIASSPSAHISLAVRGSPMSRAATSRVTTWPSATTGCPG